ncbi:MAG TPA: glycosyltransferase family 4 protein [Pyrinomonadaceae bacterium]
MRILHLSSAKAFGGGERHLADLVNSLVARGHELYAALPPHSPLRAHLSALPAKNIFDLTLRNALDLKGAFELSGLVRRLRPEIVHAHMARDYPPAAFATRLNKHSRLIITRHVLFPLNRLHAATLSHAARVIAVSRAVARSLSGQKIFPAEKIAVVPNGIDTSRFEQAAPEFELEELRRSLNLEPGRLLVGTVGEIKRLKGLEEFLRAAAIVVRKLPNVDFILAGSDLSPKGEHLAATRRLIDELKLGSHVHLTGWLEDVAPLLSTLDLFVSASHTESFGLSMVEAMASGLTVVATETEGAREIIEAGRTGLLVPVCDEQALARAILALLEDAAERKRLGAAARAAARERFSLERMVAATERIYLEAISNG